MFDLLQILLFAAHVVSVGIGGVGPLFCVWLDSRSRRQVARRTETNQAVPDEIVIPVEHLLARQLAVWSVVMLVIGAVLGAAQLAVMWLGSDRYYFELLGLIARERLEFGGIEWLFSIGCMSIYLWVQARRPYLRSLPGLIVFLLPLASATNALYHFPILFAVITVLGFEGVVAASAPIKFIQYLFDEVVLLRAAHFIGAAVMVTSAFLMWLCLRASGGDEKCTASAKTVIQQAGIVAVVAVGAEIVLGISMLSVLPDTSQRALLGGDLLATSVFFASVIAVVGSLHQLGMICLGRCDARHVTWMAANLLLIVVLMSTARHASHRAVWRHRSEAVDVSIQHQLEWLLAPSVQHSRPSSGQYGVPL